VPPNKPAHRRSRRDPAWIATAVVGFVLAAVVGTLVAHRQTGPAPKPAPAGAADRNAPAALVKAADALNFTPSSEPGTGVVEGKPASAVVAPYSTHLLKPGTVAPGFTLRTPQGQTVSLAQYRGRAVMLELFTTWCPHCQAEAPHLRSLALALGTSQYAFVSVDADSEDAASVFAYHRYFGLPFPALLDPTGTPRGSYTQSGGLGRVAQAYGVGAYPTLYVIGTDGRVVWASDGEQPDAFLRKTLVAAAGG
jgi:peroxiredoxin